MKPSSVAAGGLAAIVTLAVMLLLGPRPITLGEETTGDASVSDALRTHADPGHHELAAFYLGNGDVRFGGLGADEHTEFEIGSITKTFNACLLYTSPSPRD